MLIEEVSNEPVVPGHSNNSAQGSSGGVGDGSNANNSTRIALRANMAEAKHES